MRWASQEIIQVRLTRSLQLEPYYFDNNKVIKRSIDTILVSLLLKERAHQWQTLSVKLNENRL